MVEAAYEHLQGTRLRHTAQFRRWRPDRDARSCTYDQLDAVVPMELADVFGASKRAASGGTETGTATETRARTGKGATGEGKGTNGDR